MYQLQDAYFVFYLHPSVGHVAQLPNAQGRSTGRNVGIPKLGLITKSVLAGG